MTINLLTLLVIILLITLFLVIKQLLALKQVISQQAINVANAEQRIIILPENWTKKLQQIR